MKILEEISSYDFKRILEETAREQGYRINGDRFQKEEEIYELKIINSTQHEYGVGGYNLWATRLFRIDQEKNESEIINSPQRKYGNLQLTRLFRIDQGEKIVLETEHFAEWDTGPDDNADYLLEKRRFTELHSEELLPTKTFEKIEQFLKEKNETKKS